jgi:hypothetical protein
MKKTQSLFAIYLLEDEDGKVTVNVDSVGFGANCSTIGMELVTQLLSAEILSNGYLTVAVPVVSDQIQ